VPMVPLAAVLPEWAQKMTTPATTATSATAAITGTSGRRERRGALGAGVHCRPPSIAVGKSPDGIGPGSSIRVASGPAGGGAPSSSGGDANVVRAAEAAGDGQGRSPGEAGHGGGPGGGSGGRRGAYQESQGPGSGCDSGAARGDNGGGNVDCGAAGTTGSGAVDGSDGAPLAAASCPQNGQNQDPGGTGYPHAGLPQPATPAIVTAG